MPAKQKKRSNRKPRKNTSAASLQFVFTFYVEPSRGENAPTLLPQFKSIKLKKLLREKTGSTGLRSSSEITMELFEKIAAQQADLLTALGLDAAHPDYAQAFLKLARIHHGVGYIQLELARRPNKNAEKWSREQDDALLNAVDTRQQSGMTITAAIGEIAHDENIWSKFPSVTNSRSQKSPVFLRIQNYRRRLGIVRKRNAVEARQNEILDRLSKRGNP
jgi:hypothetical protein